MCSAYMEKINFHRWIWLIWSDEVVVCEVWLFIEIEVKQMVARKHMHELSRYRMMAINTNKKSLRIIREENAIFSPSHSTAIMSPKWKTWLWTSLNCQFWHSASCLWISTRSTAIEHAFRCDKKWIICLKTYCENCDAIQLSKQQRTILTNER